MHALATNTHLQKRIKGKNFLLYNSKFFAASTVAMIAISSYCIIDSVIYGWKRFENIFLLFPPKIDRFSSALILSSATFAVFSLTLLISYGVFRYRNKNNCDNKKEAGKIISNETKSVSGKMLISTSAIGAFVLACTALTASANNRDVLSAMSRAFGFSKNGSWIGGLGGLLLCFIVSSLVVFAVSSVISFCFKGKNHGRYEGQSKNIYEENFQKVMKELKLKTNKKSNSIDQTPKKPFAVGDIDFANLENLSNSQLGIAISAFERQNSNATIYSQPWDKNQASLFVQQPLQRRNSCPVINNPSQLDLDKALGKAYEDFEETAQSMKQKSKKPVPPPRKKLENKQNEGAADNGGDSILTKVESLRRAGLTI